MLNLREMASLSPGCTKNCDGKRSIDGYVSFSAIFRARWAKDGVSCNQREHLPFVMQGPYDVSG
jgi:hypothetical protein